jgi:transcriptional regulator CBF1
MADAAVVESDIVPPGPGGKRKRGTESASPDARRTRRTAPTAAMTTTDASTAAFIQSAVSAAEAAGGHVSVDDFSALQHATADHTDAADPANAAGTAAAALNSIYPTLNVPQSTEETFAAQVGAESPQQDEGTFAPVGVNDDVSQTGFSSTGVEQEARFPGNPKPQVGSEEWHKLRKDNHKEGKPFGKDLSGHDVC